MSAGARRESTAALAERRFAEAKPALEAFLAERAAAASVRLNEVRPLSGGAIQENWLLEAAFSDGPYAGRQELVLRSDAPSAVAVSLTRPQEFAVLKIAWQAGVSVPEPLWLCSDTGILGRPFYVMRRVAGTALGRRIVRDPALGGDRDALAARLGRELARIHAITPPHPDLGFLDPPPANPAADAVARYRRHLDILGAPRPALEWGLRWCETHAPKTSAIVLTHQDFRTGNYMVEKTGLSAILDWEFSVWGDPLSDIAWFCARCWRFGRDDLEAGGIAPRAAFYRGYEQASGRRIDPEAVAFWEVMAHIRWAVIALQQGERSLGGGASSLDLALTGRVYPPELERDILDMTAPGHWHPSLPPGSQESQAHG